MSMQRCEEHDRERDTDYVVDCPECVERLDLAEARLKLWEEHMRRAAQSNDRYHISGQWDIDHDHKRKLMGDVVLAQYAIDYPGVI